MSLKLTWCGHATWLVDTPQGRILLDPFFDENPSAIIKSTDVECDWILVSHGHFDHIADAAAIAKRTGAKVIAVFEVAQWLAGQGVNQTIGMNTGGTYRAEFGSVKMVPAWHSSSLPDGQYAGCPAGFVLTIGNCKIYFACDTALFSDMRLIGDLGLDAAVLPIGDLFTMGVQDSVKAVEWLNPKWVLPTHYNTWPPIEQDAEKWAELVSKETDAKAFVPAVGETFQL